MSNSLQPHELLSIRLLCPWDPPGKNAGVGYHSLLQGVLPTQGFNPCLLMSPALAGRFFTSSAIWEAHRKLQVKGISWYVKKIALDTDIVQILQQLGRSLENAVEDLLKYHTKEFELFPLKLELTKREAEEFQFTKFCLLLPYKMI